MWVATLLALASTACAYVNLFVSDYQGHISTLALSEKHGVYSLKQTAFITGCGIHPSWLTLDKARGLLYCTAEGRHLPNGTLSSYTINRDGSLVHVQSTSCIAGPVAAAIYGHPSGDRALAVAHFNGSTITAWKLDDAGRMQLFQTHTLPPFTHPGPIPQYQYSPLEHQIIFDPTGQYFVVPDRGADLVRVFSVDQATLEFKPLGVLNGARASGPRHGVFYTPSGIPGSATYFYYLGELDFHVYGYRVTYLANKGGLSFSAIDNQTTTGPFTTPDRAIPSEIHVTPDNRFLIISNRNDQYFDNRTSDSLATFHLNQNGRLTFHQLSPAGGSTPRHYSTNAIGNLVAVGLQADRRVVIFRRDVRYGVIGEEVARIDVPGMPNTVVWDEERALGMLGG